MKLNQDLIDYFRIHLDVEFAQSFFGISLGYDDLKNFLDYRKAILCRYSRLSLSKISVIIKIPRQKIENWIYQGNTPFIIRILEHYLLLGKQRNDLKWLSINSTRGGLFTGPWIKVPNTIHSYEEVRVVLEQLQELPQFQNQLAAFSFDTKPLDKANMFAYLLGALVGDSSKTTIKRKQRTTRRIQIRLSTRYCSNEQMGTFIQLCVHSLGLRMIRTKDCPAGKRNTHPFYSWASQSSPLIQWIFSVALGLNNNEITTYVPIRASWLLTAPVSFKIHFLQGLADSDGFVDFSSHQAGIIVEPNKDLVSNLLSSIGIKTTPKLFTMNKLWALMLNLKDAYTLPIFNPYVHSYRYVDLENLFKARKVKGHWPNWLVEKIEQNIKNGCNGTQLVRKILREEGIAIRTKHIRERAKKLKQMKEVTCLGIESTAP